MEGRTRTGTETGTGTDNELEEEETDELNDVEAEAGLGWFLITATEISSCLPSRSAFLLISSNAVK